MDSIWLAIGLGLVVAGFVLHEYWWKRRKARAVEDEKSLKDKPQGKQRTVLAWPYRVIGVVFGGIALMIFAGPILNIIGAILFIGHDSVERAKDRQAMAQRPVIYGATHAAEAKVERKKFFWLNPGEEIRDIMDEYGNPIPNGAEFSTDYDGYKGDRDQVVNILFRMKDGSTTLVHDKIGRKVDMPKRDIIGMSMYSYANEKVRVIITY